MKMPLEAGYKKATACKFIPSDEEALIYLAEYTTCNTIATIDNTIATKKSIEYQNK